jgi:predicted PurR-regulated permease PerM
LLLALPAMGDAETGQPTASGDGTGSAAAVGPTGHAPRQIPEWLDTGAAFAWRFLLVVAAVFVVAVVLNRLLVVVVPVIVAAMFTTVLAPFASWLRRHGWPPLLATWAVFFAAFAVIAAIVSWLVPTVSDEVTSLGHNAEHGVHQVQHWLVTGPLHLSRRQVRHDFDQIGHDFSANAGGYALQGATIAAEVVIGLLLSLVTTFFFVKDGDRLTAAALRLAGPERRAELSDLSQRAWATLTGYVRGTTANGVINGTLMGVGLAILGVPLALPIAVLTFVGAYFPLVGAFATGALAALVALASQGPVTALVVVGLTVLIHNVEGYLVGPIVLGRSVHLHPLAVLLALGVGGAIAGIIGAFLAVPVAAVAVSTFQYYRNPESEIVL